ncbi:MAG: PolC-type DNA polymerase III [Clostridiales bacterium]|nr:PolC-type DNA polymerase III [Clostridiales bacterium]
MTENSVFRIFSRLSPETVRLLPSDTMVSALKIDRNSLATEICLKSSNKITEEHIPSLVSEIKKEYGFTDVNIKTLFIEIKQEKFTENIRKDLEPIGRSRVAPEKEKRTGRSEHYAKPKKADIPDENIIFGKLYQDEPVSMETVSLESGKISIRGDVFSITFHELQNRDATVFSFDLTDYTSSVRVVKVLDRDKAAEVQNKLSVGDHILVQGNVAFSNFEKDIILAPTGIARAKKNVRKDLAEKKRVELHLHTNMSSMDGMSNASSLVKRAAEWGHSAVAITDHGVVQAFPDAMLAAKASGIKIIYGLEAYYVNNSENVSVVKGDCSASLDDEFIVFDLETTGFNAKTEKIIEIAAATIKNNTIISRFQRYVNPNKPIPAEITKLTGIEDSTVRSAKTIEEILPEFLEFIGDRPLVAHNAQFDISFLTESCKYCSMPRAFVSIDTLELSRILLPDLDRHKLNIVAQELNLGKFDHHRASADTEILIGIFQNFLGRLKNDYNIEKVDQINEVLSASHGKTRSIKGLPSHHLIVLVKDETGLKNLYRLVSEAHLKYFKKHPQIPRDSLVKYREGLILGSACESGELFSAIVDNKPFEELLKMASFYDYLEIQPIANNRFMLHNGTVENEEALRDFNRTVVKLGETLGIPVVATGDVHFLEPQDEVYRRVILAGLGFADADRQAPLHFKTTDEMLKEFSYLGEKKAFEVVVENPNNIADLCSDIKPVPSGTYPPELENSQEELENLVWGKANELYGENLPEIVKSRIDTELSSIIKHGFDVMYMIAQKLVSKSISEGYLVGSRGSVGSSVVAFFSGITEVNALAPHYRCEKCKFSEFFENSVYQCGADMPDKACPKCGQPLKKDGFSIPFATFLGFDGDKAPDIDLNFSGEYQSKAHKHTVELFGEEHVFRAGTIGTLAERTAFGFVKKYTEERNMQLGKAEENRLVNGCTGVKRTTGQHPGGLMIVPKNKSIYDFCPVQHPADDQNTDIITTHFDYHSIHDNLLKLDLLGHDDPTMIRTLEVLTGENARTIPLDEPRVMKIFTDIRALDIEPDELLGQIGTVAIPEYGTKFVREMLSTTKPTTFDELVRISGLSHGTDVWIGNAQLLIQNGTATLKDVICARDDIMNFLISKGIDPKLSFKIMEDVRKGKVAAGKCKDWDKIKEDLIANGVPSWYVDSCEKIKYMFPKAHAVAYVMMAFRIAWFKVYRPIAFYSAYFTIRAGAFDSLIMTRGDEFVCAKYKELSAKPTLSALEKEMQSTLEVCHEFYKRGFSFTSVDIYKSDTINFLISGNTLIPPLTSLQGVGEQAANGIVSERQKEPFLSIEELSLRCSKASKTVVETLQKSGALDCLPESTQVSLF